MLKDINIILIILLDLDQICVIHEIQRNSSEYPVISLTAYYSIATFKQMLMVSGSSVFGILGLDYK